MRCGSGFLARAARDFSRNWTFWSLETQNFARQYNTVARGSSPARNFRRLSAFRQITATFGKTFAKVSPRPMWSARHEQPGVPVSHDRLWPTVTTHSEQRTLGLGLADVRIGHVMTWSGHVMGARSAYGSLEPSRLYNHRRADLTANQGAKI